LPVHRNSTLTLAAPVGPPSPGDGDVGGARRRPGCSAPPPLAGQPAGEVTAITFWYPVDLGGGLAKVIDQLAADWTSTGYDIRWLCRTLANTQVYQRHLQPRSTSEAPVLVAVCPSRLRPEQIFEALVKTLGFKETDKSIPAPASPSKSGLVLFMIFVRPPRVFISKSGLTLRLSSVRNTNLSRGFIFAASRRKSALSTRI